MAVNQQETQNNQPKWWDLLVEGDYLNERPRRGDVFEATILSIGDHDIFVELNGKRDGEIQERDLENVKEEYLEGLAVGDRIPVRVIKVPVDQSAVIVSLKQGLEHKDWLRAENLMEDEEVIEVEVSGVNRGGVLAPLGRLRGFIPNSHLTSIPRGANRDKRQEIKKELVGKTLSVMVIEVNQRRRRLILSERVAAALHRKELLAELHEGAIRTGIVSNLVDFGAFIDLGGIDGLLHISEISWDHIGHPRDVLEVGEEVEIYVLDVDRDRERIALSRKRLLPDPWEQVTDKLHRGDVVEGTITHVTDFGAFVDVGEGVEGLVHVSEMPQGERTLTELVPSSKAQVRILNIDPLKQRISLRLEEQIEPEPEAAAETEPAEAEAEPEADEEVETAEESMAEAPVAEAASSEESTVEDEESEVDETPAESDELIEEEAES
jgi:small subunit ribosomal protein S1